MSIFFLKFLATPTLMLAISLAARRWGSHVGGILSGLPVTSALVMLFLGLEQGSSFVLQAVPGAIAGVAAIQATYLFYISATRRLKIWVGCLSALACYGLAAFLLNQAASLAVSLAVILCMVIAIVPRTSRMAGEGEAGYVPTPRWIIPMRMITATLLLLMITLSAEWLGPTISGLMAPIPVIAWPLAVFAHLQGGRRELGAVVRGNAIGALGVAGFYLTLKYSVLQLGISLSVTIASLIAVLITLLAAHLLRARHTP
ncbi:hypothetical protein [Pseudomonas sp. PA27(2017)]|uniref:hypothetical protein n=1 Tax=Pseudomonas sp. PA27(2017) TaxID=1932112 RepID=UPI00095AA50C|nr:hypothetical protein [Pseudomonas sp. PA27(2017)]OLU26525.1 hypothetical protein BVH06_19090 [Pseudomonas sp. PA27(2017)]